MLAVQFRLLAGLDSTLDECELGGEAAGAMLLQGRQSRDAVVDADANVPHWHEMANFTGCHKFMYQCNASGEPTHPWTLATWAFWKSAFVPCCTSGNYAEALCVGMQAELFNFSNITGRHFEDPGRVMDSPEEPLADFCKELGDLLVTHFDHRKFQHATDETHKPSSSLSTSAITRVGSTNSHMNVASDVERAELLTESDTRSQLFQRQTAVDASHDSEVLDQAVKAKGPM